MTKASRISLEFLLFHGVTTPTGEETGFKCHALNSTNIDEANEEAIKWLNIRWLPAGYRWTFLITGRPKSSPWQSMTSLDVRTHVEGGVDVDKAEAADKIRKRLRA